MKLTSLLAAQLPLSRCLVRLPKFVVHHVTKAALIQALFGAFNQLRNTPTESLNLSVGVVVRIHGGLIFEVWQLPYRGIQLDTIRDFMPVQLAENLASAWREMRVQVFRAGLYGDVAALPSRQRCVREKEREEESIYLDVSLYHFIPPRLSTTEGLQH
jgi:hypothetical protein